MTWSNEFLISRLVFLITLFVQNGFVIALLTSKINVITRTYRVCDATKTLDAYMFHLLHHGHSLYAIDVSCQLYCHLAGEVCFGIMTLSSTI